MRFSRHVRSVVVAAVALALGPAAADAGAATARAGTVESAAAPAAAIGEARITAALLEALGLATERVVADLGRPGGFLEDPAIRIPLPGGLARMRGGLVRAGLGPLIEDLELRMNRAAEQAVAEVPAVFGEALAATTIEDARGLLGGADDSATRYFADRMGPLLAERMTPIVDAELREAGALQAFEAFLAAYARLPLMPDIRGTLTSHVVDGALAGVFRYMAEAERAIRRDPVAQTTALLRRVFGGR